MHPRRGDELKGLAPERKRVPVIYDLHPLLRQVQEV